MRIALSLLLAALPAAMWAQTPCVAAVRSLSAQSPRMRDDELNSGVWASRDLIADGAECAVAADMRSGQRFNLFGLSGHVGLVSPSIRLGYTGGIPQPTNDGSAWNGRGASSFVRAGVSADLGPLHAVLAPDFWSSQNKPFGLFPSRDTTRSSFASPWYAFPYSIDLPSRFGDSPIRTVELGESALWLSVGPIDIGASSSTQRWGPGEFSSVILGGDAPGIPRLFVRTSRPIVTPVGVFSGTAFIGTLTESRFFDSDPSNDLRTIRAFTTAWSPSNASELSVGVAHASQRMGTSFGSQAGNQPVRGPDQALNSVFARYGDGGALAGIRAYVELGRQDLPSLREFFTVPYSGLVYVVGLDRAMTYRSGTLVVSGEAADFEQPTDIRGQATQDFYTSSVIAQGWTQRGQPLGAATGPGSQSQNLSADWVAGRWSVGVFGERVRWNEDAFLREYLPYPFRHDVSVLGGIRAGLTVGSQEVTIEGSTGKRLNYLFQNDFALPGYRTVDVAIPQLRITINPVLHRSK